MDTQMITRRPRGSWRGVLSLALVLSLSLLLVPAALAQDGHSTITLYTRGAPAGAWASVQWQDQLGEWHAVSGWQAPLDVVPFSNIAYKQWGVEPDDYGRGPFRWVVTAGQAGTIWTTSPTFYLPDGDGATLNMTLGAATAAASEFATIVVRAPDAPAGAWVGVQWQDALGAWHPVDSWQAPLVPSPATQISTGQFAVLPADYGDGPFRWVINTSEGGPVWATSARFFLPEGDGATLAMTVAPKIAIVPAEDLTAELQAQVATLPAETSTERLHCARGGCDHSLITLQITGAPANSLVGVQWQDGFGVWHDVRGWQGSLDPSADGQTLLKQWTISPEIYGRGPFRWVLYNPLGDTLLGVSPNFMLPEDDGLDLRLSVNGAG